MRYAILMAMTGALIACDGVAGGDTPINGEGEDYGVTVPLAPEWLVFDEPAFMPGNAEEGSMCRSNDGICARDSAEAGSAYEILICHEGAFIRLSCIRESEDSWAGACFGNTRSAICNGRGAPEGLYCMPQTNGMGFCSGDGERIMMCDDNIVALVHECGWGFECYEDEELGVARCRER